MISLYIMQLSGAMSNDLFLCLGAVSRFRHGFFLCIAHAACTQVASGERARISVCRLKQLAFTSSFCAEVAHDDEGEKSHSAHGQCDECIKPEGALDAPRVG